MNRQNYKLNNVVDRKKLIKEVKVRRPLWDKAHVQYKNRHATATLWNEVSTAINCDVLKCKASWKSLTDQFRKNRKLSKGRSEDGVLDVPNVKWSFYKQLQFLAGCSQHSDSVVTEDTCSSVGGTENTSRDSEGSDDIETIPPAIDENVNFEDNVRENENDSSNILIVDENINVEWTPPRIVSCNEDLTSKLIETQDIKIPRNQVVRNEIDRDLNGAKKLFTGAISHINVNMTSSYDSISPLALQVDSLLKELREDKRHEFQLRLYKVMFKIHKNIKASYES
ncbi:hypothetical protein CHUAL_005790 [Chamberlinius hualienensis]